MARRAAIVLSLFLSACGSCGSCGSKDNASANADGGAPSSPSGSASVVAEILPRCRGDAQRLPIPGEDSIVGDVAIGPGGLLVGIIRSDGGKRIGSVLRAPLDLSSHKMIDVGPALGDDPPPSPRWNGSTAFVAFLGRQAPDGGSGTKLRTLSLAKVADDGAALGKVEATILQQADESTAFDLAWSENGPALVAWDEDAPMSLGEAGAAAPGAKEGSAISPDVTQRGFIKVQGLASEAPRRVASPESSDAESPRLLPRPGGGFWLAWLARRVEEEAYAVEGPGERRAYRWVEVVPLDAKGDAAGPVRRVSSEKGRATAFELAKSGNDLIVIVQDEVSPIEGGGARIVRHRVPTEHKERVEPADIVDSGVGNAIVELVPIATPADQSITTRWLAWSDTHERTHMTPLGTNLISNGRTSAEPTLDHARVLAAGPPDSVYALIGTGAENKPGTPPELRRFVCK